MFHLLPIHRLFFLSALLCGLLTPSLFAQNLVPNGDFESIVAYDNPCGSWASYTTGFGSCPHSSLGCDLSNWFEPGGGSTDIYTKCNCPATGTGTFRCEGENGLFDSGGPVLEPANGNSSIWLRYYGFGSSIIDYATVELTDPLEAGEMYEVSFEIALGPGTRYGSIGAFGLFFSTGDPTWGGPFTLPSPFPVPQLPSSPLNLTDGTGAWQTVTEFWTVPAGSPDLHFMTIGHWLPFNTARVEIDPSATTRNHADVFVDNLSITPASPLAITQDTSTTELEVTPPAMPLRPNPVRAGEQLWLPTDLPGELRQVEWLDLAGRTLVTDDYPGHLAAPSQAGIYQLKLVFEAGAPVYRRVQVID